MKKTKFTETQIVKAIKEAEAGRSVAATRPSLFINPLLWIKLFRSLLF